MTELVQQLASELAVRPAQIEATIRLLDEGASVPFIARYRKEVTEGLDDTQLRQLEARLIYLRDLNERRQKIIDSIRSQDKLSDTLLARLNAADSKTALEDLYLPYRPKRTSKAALAREAGLEPYALKIWQEDIDPEAALAGFVPASGTEERYPDVASQLEAIQHILVDLWATRLELTEQLKQGFAATAQLVSRLAGEEKREVGKKFRDYFESSESLAKLANHRLLAMLRGRQENVLTLKVDGEDAPRLAEIFADLQLNEMQPESRQQFLKQTGELLWLGKLRPHFEHSLLTEKRLAAEADAMKVFAENLRHLLLAAPAGGRCTLGVDPGIRTGVKLAVVNSAGDVLAHSTIYPFAPKNDTEGALAELERLCREHQVDLVAIGNGTASRETENLLGELAKKHPELNLTRVTVSEAGASVYSASELAAQELPELDVSIRGAVSIARRLQDPLAELVKIDPKSIGVGQYQHDVNQTGLARTLDAVVEDCVNAVGVDVNTASPALLSRIAGLNKNIAQQIADYRREHGVFNNRQQLKKVPRLGDRTFEQAAGFLRIQDGEALLDRSAVHPESYPLVEKILARLGKSLDQVLGKADVLSGINAEEFVDEQYGLPTVQDVLSELSRPGRDPRPEFRMPKFRADIQSMQDLNDNLAKSTLLLEGVVTNVTNFGAFVDIGVHQDGLIHVSELSSQFVNDPHKIVKPGQIVQVRVMSVDVERKRISLSLRLNPEEKPERAPRSFNNEQRKQAKPATRKSGEHTPKRQDRPSAKPHDKAAKPSEPKIGGLGALLLQAGVKKSG
ncbi:Tex family protein [Alkanindiges illinoisensis]|uniref:RNA-binding transcriptional accessory protein n=1 Tax=Alkanindiges illinoisensis TaxID=197183 RepID=A0A4Y7X9H8_9GAMM|nr:Tex family protein [Alkanindiges illinoisensis]TEU24215.1 RNA-binding transcriptional accessory protein [Alkanindiges illinoisensis]